MARYDFNLKADEMREQSKSSIETQIDALLETIAEGIKRQANHDCYDYLTTEINSNNCATITQILKEKGFEVKRKGIFTEISWEGETN